MRFRNWKCFLWQLALPPCGKMFTLGLICFPLFRGISGLWALSLVSCWQCASWMFFGHNCFCPLPCFNTPLQPKTLLQSAVTLLTSCVQVAGLVELLHMSLGKCVYGWTDFWWCHWHRKRRRVGHEVHSAPLSGAWSAWLNSGYARKRGGAGNMFRIMMCSKMGLSCFIMRQGKIGSRRIL